MIDSQNTEVSVNHTQRVRPTDPLGLSEGLSTDISPLIYHLVSELDKLAETSTQEIQVK